jgi:hypothetical protein
MSGSNGSTRGRKPYLNGKNTPSRPLDERIGDWSRPQLLRMDARFVARVERAISLGLERRPDEEAPERAA